MTQYYPLISGAVALGIELFVYLSLMELPPFGEGDSDIIWGLPLFGLVVLVLTIPGLLMAIRAKNNPSYRSKIVRAGLIANGLGLAMPVLLFLFGIVRALVAR